MRIPICAATASANKEVSKQNELLLNQALDGDEKSMSSAIQALENAHLPAFDKAAKETAIGKCHLMRPLCATSNFQIRRRSTCRTSTSPRPPPNAQAPQQRQQPQPPTHRFPGWPRQFANPVVVERSHFQVDSQASAEMEAEWATKWRT